MTANPTDRPAGAGSEAENRVANDGAGALRLSIIIVSRHRRAHLAFCLMALAAQTRPRTEIILVADPAALDLRPDLALKRVAFDEANISAARNAGIAVAAGEIIAFIDDDALALPHWTERIAAPFRDPRVLSATGYTRGPDGFGWQARAERITPLGTTRPIEVKAVSALPPEAGAPISTIGTNCAFRAQALREIGGFDPAFPYHLDESDVNLRMAARFPDGLCAVVPEAEVIHGAAAGPLRASSGVPSDLTQIGRSAAIFTRRHGGEEAADIALPALIEAQRKRLLRLMLSGRLDPFQLKPLLAGLARGIADGRARDLPVLPQPMTSGDEPAFLPQPQRLDMEPVFLKGWYWQAGALRREAAQAVASGRITYLALWTPTRLPLRLRLTEGGWWEQRAGTFARIPAEIGNFQHQSPSGAHAPIWPIHAAFCRHCAVNKL